MAGPLVDVHRLACIARQMRQVRRAYCQPAGAGPADRTGAGRVALGNPADGFKSAAGGARIVVGGHGQRSCEIGMLMLPSRWMIGPAADGLMSNWKISVGSHSVAQAFGMSTTPLMWPCTGAVPRME